MEFEVRLTIWIICNPVKIMSGRPRLHSANPRSRNLVHSRSPPPLPSWMGQELKLSVVRFIVLTLKQQILIESKDRIEFIEEHADRIRNGSKSEVHCTKHLVQSAFQACQVLVIDFISSFNILLLKNS